MTTTRISFSTNPFNAPMTPLSSLMGKFPLPYAERMTARHVGTASICAERSVPVIPGCIEAEITDWVVIKETSLGGKFDDLAGKREFWAEMSV